MQEVLNLTIQMLESDFWATDETEIKVIQIVNNIVICNFLISSRLNEILGIFMYLVIQTKDTTK